MKYLAILLVVLLSSCSALKTAASLASPSDGVSVDAQIGKEANKQVVVGDQNKTDTGDIVTKGTEVTGETVTVNNETPLFRMLLSYTAVFIVGILMPSPFEIVRWVRRQRKLIAENNDGSN